MPRWIVTPGVSRWHQIMPAGGAGRRSGSVLPITMKILQRGSIAPDDHHLRPLITYSSPSRSIRVAMLVASDEATSGSVMQNADRISAVQQRLQPPLALLGAAELGEHLHVPGVRRRAVQRLGCELRRCGR